MASPRPNNSPPGPQRKNFWRLSRVSRAQPHLGEHDGIPPAGWILLGVVMLGVTSFAIWFWGVSKAPSTLTTLPTVAFSATMPLTTPTVPAPVATVVIIVVPPSTIAMPDATLTALPHTAPALPTITPTATRPANLTARYRVQPGDTLISIADKYHITVTDILRANNRQSDVIRVGEELLIPLPTWRP